MEFEWVGIIKGSLFIKEAENEKILIIVAESFDMMSGRMWSILIIIIICSKWNRRTRYWI